MFLGWTVKVNGLTAGGGLVCAITQTSGVKCWGWNYYGGLGNGSTSNTNYPVDVVGLSNGVDGIASGDAHACAKTIDGRVMCWGFNISGMIGDGTTINRLTPVTVLLFSTLRITSESPLPIGVIGTPYSTTLLAEGGNPPYTWSVASGALPPGLLLASATGIISGTPTTAGTFGFTVQVTDSSQVIVTKQFTVAPPPPSGTAGSSYTIPISVPDTPPTGGGTPSCTNYELTSGILPAGMFLDPTTGVISGTPLDGGTYTFTVQCVVSAGQTATKDFTITILNPLPTITQLIPDSARANSGDFTLHVIGTNFVQSSVVHWNSTPLTTTYISATELTAAITNSDIAIQGSADVTVVNPEPNGGTSNTAMFTILPPNYPPSVTAGGPYNVGEGASITVTATGSDPDNDLLTYAWDLDNDGVFETPGQNPTFSAALLDGPGTSTIAVKVTDPGGLSATDQATVNIRMLPQRLISPTPQA